MSTLHTIREATLAARVRTGDKDIGAQVARGLVDVVRAVPPASGRGRYVVTVLCAGLTADAAVAFLGAMQ